MAKTNTRGFLGINYKSGWNYNNSKTLGLDHNIFICLGWLINYPYFFYTTIIKRLFVEN